MQQPAPPVPPAQAVQQTRPASEFMQRMQLLFAMGLHPRLGRRSVLSLLPSVVLAVVLATLGVFLPDTPFYNLVERFRAWRFDAGSVVHPVEHDREFATFFLNATHPLLESNAGDIYSFRFFYPAMENADGGKLHFETEVHGGVVKRARTKVTYGNVNPTKFAVKHAPSVAAKLIPGGDISDDFSNSEDIIDSAERDHKCAKVRVSIQHPDLDFFESFSRVKGIGRVYCIYDPFNGKRLLQSWRARPDDVYESRYFAMGGDDDAFMETAQHAFTALSLVSSLNDTSLPVASRMRRIRNTIDRHENDIRLIQRDIDRVYNRIRQHEAKNVNVTPDFEQMDRLNDYLLELNFDKAQGERCFNKVHKRLTKYNKLIHSIRSIVDTLRMHNLNVTEAQGRLDSLNDELENREARRRNATHIREHIDLVNQRLSKLQIEQDKGEKELCELQDKLHRFAPPPVDHRERCPRCHRVIEGEGGMPGALCGNCLREDQRKREEERKRKRDEEEGAGGAAGGAGAV